MGRQRERSRRATQWLDTMNVAPSIAARGGGYEGHQLGHDAGTVEGVGVGAGDDERCLSGRLAADEMEVADVLRVHGLKLHELELQGGVGNQRNSADKEVDHILREIGALTQGSQHSGAAWVGAVARGGRVAGGGTVVSRVGSVRGVGRRSGRP